MKAILYLFLSLVMLPLVSCQSTSKAAQAPRKTEVLYTAKALRAHRDPEGVAVPPMPRLNLDDGLASSCLHGVARTLIVTGRIAVGGIAIAGLPFAGASPDGIQNLIDKPVDEPRP